MTRTESDSNSGSANRNARLSLVPEPGETFDRVTVSVRVAEAAQIQGYGLELLYDADALELVDVTAQIPSRFAQATVRGPVALQSPAQNPDVIHPEFQRLVVRGAQEVRAGSRAGVSCG